jgi:hypothetical protein
LAVFEAAEAEDTMRFLVGFLAGLTLGFGLTSLLVKQDAASPETPA